MIPEDAIWILELIRNRGARTEAEKDAVNAAIEALKAQLSREGTTKDATSDLISRTATIDAVNNAFDRETLLAVFVRSIALRAIRDMPSAQPEPTDINAKEAVYNLAEKIGIHQLFALTVELRGEPIQPEPHEGHWIKHIDPSDGEQYECSRCGVLWEFNDGTPEENEAYYCPKCGAKMIAK